MDWGWFGVEFGWFGGGVAHLGCGFGWLLGWVAAIVCYSLHCLHPMAIHNQGVGWGLCLAQWGWDWDASLLGCVLGGVGCDGRLVFNCFGWTIVD